MSKTNIQVSRETRDRLAQLGRKDDTYDDIVRRLIEFYYVSGGLPEKEQSIYIFLTIFSNVLFSTLMYQKT